MTGEDESMFDELATVPLEVLRHVLWRAGDFVLGLQPGHFTERLLAAMTLADSQNLALLGRGFPDYVLAFSLILGREGGVDRARALAKAQVPA